MFGCLLTISALYYTIDGNSQTTIKKIAEESS